jgi:hypothetical protein
MVVREQVEDLPYFESVDYALEREHSADIEGGRS